MSLIAHDAQNEELQEQMERLQGRFKVVASMMGCLQDYFPRAKAGAAAGASSSPSTGSLTY